MSANDNYPDHGELRAIDIILVELKHDKAKQLLSEVQL